MTPIRKLSVATRRVGQVAAFCLAATAALCAWAEDSPELDFLFEQLQTADQASAQILEYQILTEWSESGSPALNLLLARGREAIANQKYPEAINYLSALVDHAPEFAEGWNARATALFMAGYHDLSMQDIGQTLLLNPRHFGAISGLSMIMEMRGDNLAALKALELVQEIHPNRRGLADAVSRLQEKTRDLHI